MEMEIGIEREHGGGGGIEERIVSILQFWSLGKGEMAVNILNSSLTGRPL